MPTGSHVRKLDATEDHVQPRCDGFHKPYNSAFACYRCNNGRNAGPFTPCMLFFAREVWRAWDEFMGQRSGVPVKRPIGMDLERLPPLPTVMAEAFSEAVARRRSRLERMQSAHEARP